MVLLITVAFVSTQICLEGTLLREYHRPYKFKFSRIFFITRQRSSDFAFSVVIIFPIEARAASPDFFTFNITKLCEEN